MNYLGHHFSNCFYSCTAPANEFTNKISIITKMKVSVIAYKLCLKLVVTCSRVIIMFPTVF